MTIMIKKIRDLAERRGAGEKGFTLVELLVVIIIIGILAAIAIPIFLNQQRSAVDAAVTSDVRNVAVSIETLRTKNPTATAFAISDASVTTHPAGNDNVTGNSNGLVRVWVGGEYMDVSVSEGTFFRVGVYSAGEDGNFIVRGWNPDGSYSGEGTNENRSAISYLSTNGGIVKNS